MRQITVGIPSYNEEKNILNLLHSIDVQQINRASLEVIISDDSSDRTPGMIEGYARKSGLSIRLLHHKHRRGAASAWNEIFEKATGDVIILYDADVVPHPSCTAELASQISGRVGLCASNSKPVETAGVAGRASAFISDWLGAVRQAMISQYTVMGRALSIDASIAKEMTIPAGTIAIDLYLQCKVLELGHEVAYNPDAVVYFKPASRMPDFVSQVARATHGHTQLSSYLEGQRIELPLKVALAEAAKGAARDPLGAIAVALGLAVMPYYKAKLAGAGIYSAKWHRAESSKDIDYRQLRSRF